MKPHWKRLPIVASLLVCGLLLMNPGVFCQLSDREIVNNQAYAYSPVSWRQTDQQDFQTRIDLTLAQVVFSIQNGIVDRNVGVVTDSTALEAVLRVSSVPMSLWEMEQIIVKRSGTDFVTLGDISRINSDAVKQIDRRNYRACLSVQLLQCLHLGFISGRPEPDGIRRIFTFRNSFYINRMFRKNFLRS
jgi:hypothetical protein